MEQTHLSIVSAAVEQERQRLSHTKKIIEENVGKPMSSSTLTRFLKVITALTNESGNAPGGQCDKDFYNYKVTELKLLEQRSNHSQIDLYYGDEVQISQEGNVPYGWQFKDENISIKTAKGKRINCFGMITGNNDFEFKTTYDTIDSNFITEQLNNFSCTIKKHTVIVLDNAKVHQSKAMKAMQDVWAKRQLFIFYLPPYSPHLNMIERVWKELKERWIKMEDYVSSDNLFYNTKMILNEIGKKLYLKFTKITSA